MVIVPGTGVLDDFGERPFSMPFLLFLLGALTKLRRVKLAFLAVGAGPIEHPLSRFFMKWSARLATYISFRDQASKDYMLSIGLNCSDAPVIVDIAFLLTPPPVRPPGDEITLGLGLMTYMGWRCRSEDAYESYLKAMTEICLHFLAAGCRVQLVRGDAGDDRAVNELMQNVRDRRPDLSHRLCRDNAADLRDIMAVFARTDVAVVTRFHNLVCALNVCRPTYAFGYSEKYPALMKRIGLNEFQQSIEDMDVPDAISKIEHLISKRSHLSCEIANRIVAFADEINREIDLLIETAKVSTSR
jgi:polysaccharide pyruvyl transferase WcaK-like protein